MAGKTNQNCASVDLLCLVRETIIIIYCCCRWCHMRVQLSGFSDQTSRTHKQVKWVRILGFNFPVVVSTSNWQSHTNSWFRPIFHLQIPVKQNERLSLYQTALNMPSKKKWKFVVIFCCCLQIFEHALLWRYGGDSNKESQQQGT